MLTAGNPTRNPLDPLGGLGAGSSRGLGMSGFFPAPKAEAPFTTGQRNVELNKVKLCAPDGYPRTVQILFPLFIGEGPDQVSHVAFEDTGEVVEG